MHSTFKWLAVSFFFCVRLRFDGHSTRWRWRSVELRLFVPLRSDSAGPALPSHPSCLACIPLTAISSRLCGWLRERDPVVAEQMPRTKTGRPVSTAPDEPLWFRPPDPTWTRHRLVSIAASHGAETLLLMSRSPISSTLSPLSPRVMSHSTIDDRSSAGLATGN